MSINSVFNRSLAFGQMGEKLRLSRAGNTSAGTQTGHAAATRASGRRPISHTIGSLHKLAGNGSAPLEKFTSNDPARLEKVSSNDPAPLQLFKSNDPAPVQLFKSNDPAPLQKFTSHDPGLDLSA